MQTDHDLIAAYLRGDADSLNELMRRHLGRVRAAVFAIVLDNNDADDLTQDIFVRAIRGLPGFGGRSEFSTWLYRIVVNCTRTFLEQRSRHATATEMLSAAELVHVDPLPLPSEQDEFDQKVREGLEKLSVPLRTALVLVSMQGRPVGEVAKIEGCLPATIYWRVHQARKLMKQFLAEH